MKAYVVEKYGPDGLRAADVAEPVVGPRDVLVQVAAAGINPLDTMVRNGEFKQLLRYKLPFILGHDVAGTVVRVGPGVTRFAVGDEVYSRPRDLRIGTFAERIAVDEDDVAHKPATLSMEEAAAVPLVALAAKQVLVDVAGVGPGQKVLVHAGAGGLGATVVQYAKHLGAHVTVTANGDDEAKVRNLGADDVIDYRTADFATVLADVDVVIDSLGGANLEKSLTVLRRGGLAVSVVGPPDPAFASQLGQRLLAPVMAALSWTTRRRARKLGVRYAFFFMHADGTALAEIAELYDKGVLRPTLDRTFGFDQTPEALAHVEQGKAKGKVVVAVPSEARA